MATCPKIVETFGSAEFYSPVAQSCRNTRRSRHSTAGERAPVLLAERPARRRCRRVYTEGAADNCCVLARNPNSSAETNRALMHALVDWVVKDAPPPHSRFPRLDHGDLAPPTQAAIGFPIIPGAPLPDSVFVPFYQYSYGPQFRNTDVSGLVSIQPPLIRQTLPMLVPRVDADGNETSGVRSVLLEAPLGTYTGWNPIARGFSKGRIQPLAGGFIPFAKTKAQRLASGDPRFSLEERYGTHDGYVARVKAAAERLEAARFLLPDDAERLIAQAKGASCCVDCWLRLNPARQCPSDCHRLLRSPDGA